MSGVFNLTFKGYWRDCNRHRIPHVSGVYIVYNCTYNATEDTVLLNKILYIGKSVDINERLASHTNRDSFLKACGSENNLCYSFAEVNESDLDLVENALIYAQQPPLNDVLKDKYNYPESEFHIEGRCALMKHKDFTIK